MIQAILLPGSVAGRAVVVARSTEGAERHVADGSTRLRLPEGTLPMKEQDIGVRLEHGSEATSLLFPALVI